MSADPAAPTARSARGWPVAEWLRHYPRAAFGKDSVGALTAWALIVPECVAYAQIAGVPIQNAFYAAPVALVAYALFGTSNHLIVGATSAAAVLSASTVSEISASPGQAATLSAALALIAGVILIAAGVARLGFVADFLAAPALVGFLFGMALTIVVRQCAKIVGVSGGDGDFFARAWHLLRHLGDWGATAVAVGLIAIAALLVLERFLPRLPAALIVLLAGIAASAVLNLKDHGVAIVGKIPRAVPTPAWPNLPLHEWTALIGGAFGLALVVFAESFSISQQFAAKHGESVDASREMTAMGAANAAVGVFRGFAVSGSASRSAAAEASGAKTPMASLVAAVVVLITGAFLTPLFTDLPEPVLGAIVIVAVRGFLKVGEMRRYWRLDRLSFAIAATALAGVLLFDLLPGLVIAVGLSLLLFIGYASRPRVAPLGRIPATDVFGDTALHPGAETVPGLLIVRPDAQVFFGNVGRIRDDILDQVHAADPKPSVVVLDLAASYGLGLPRRDEFAALDKTLEQRGIRLWFAHVHVRLDGEDVLAELHDTARILPDADAAVRAFRAENATR
ncbi:SulP family inorganic anion transporter [Catenulispora pinisilvae]|uniref:SulP family inorganic anion transporter n=1 Tax=Catenulispora pinisilvae TaxID=2705253 RepID=UPI0018924638|nr:SulP family inorganic anion transporter [Catenulispora pinisilvae]